MKISVIPKRVGLIVRFVLACVSIIVGSQHTSANELTMQHAQELIENYWRAIDAADTATVLQLFSSISTEQEGFWKSLHIGIGYIGDLDDFRQFSREYTPSVTDIEPRGSYSIAHFHWTPSPTTPDTSARPIPMHYYIIDEGDRFVMINPIDILTQNWLRYEGQVCRFHISRRSADGDHIYAMQRMDSLCKELVQLFNSPTGFMVDVYVATTGPECGELILHPPAGGYACAQRNLVTTTSFINPHELVHILSTGGRRKLFINAAFAEGLSVALGGTYFSRPEFAIAQARNIAESAMYIPVGTLLFLDDSSFLASSQVTYQESGSFVRYLLEIYGLPALLNLYNCNNGTEDLRSCITSTFSATVEELEREWLHFNDTASIPTVGTGDIPDSAEPVLAITDQIGDDKGGGDYSYPTDGRFVEGNLDITRFEVLKDKEMVYFQVEFRNLGKPLLDESSGHTMVPGLTIGIRRDGDHLQKQCSGVHFADNSGIDLRLDIGLGIVAYDSFGQAIFSSGTIWDGISDYTYNTLTFALPVEVIGDPDNAWGYFAASMLITDFGYGFLRSFPCPVVQEPSRFRFGGASSSNASPFVDLILPDGIEQADLFKKCNPRKGKQLVVPLVRAQ